MFKKGDIVENYKITIQDYTVTIPGTICRVIESLIYLDIMTIEIVELSPRVTERSAHIGSRYRVYIDDFKLVKRKKPITEIEFLDAFQRNFKEGY